MTQKKRQAPPEVLLTRLLREVEELRRARDDDAVSEEEWLRRANMAMLRGKRLPKKQADQFLLVMGQEQLAEIQERKEPPADDADARV